MRKIRNDGRLIDIEPRMDALRACLGAVRGLAAAYLYGSYGTPYQTPLSDVDLALVYRMDALPSFGEELETIGRVIDATCRDDVSVTTLNRAPVIFQFRVLETGRLIHCADPVALADFVEQVLQRHGDYVIDYERFLREYDAALVERYRHE